MSIPTHGGRGVGAVVNTKVHIPLYSADANCRDVNLCVQGYGLLQRAVQQNLLQNSYTPRCDVIVPSLNAYAGPSLSSAVGGDMMEEPKSSAEASAERLLCCPNKQALPLCAMTRVVQ